ncbi:VOC family protein [Pseudonocardia humida]|uniref:VOC family protein n=1 Tax=Pseudonocardia humida TaxID=2800819 RepID=A0ABT0ZYL3_9PSEU|nr:VOC family protein [Pseudonocardia humida]MCO1655830.1 VOC family protein [Pseudonocardia humida]
MADDVDRYPHGVPCWIDTTHPDVPGAARFYRGLFGWDVRETPAGLVARIDGHDVAGIGGPPGGPAEPGWTTYIRVDGADDAVAAVRRAGGRVLAEPSDVEGAGRTATVADPSGAVFRLWEARGRRGAEVVNDGADGAWNWSNLQTPDPAGAQAFYAAVFGWRAVPLGPSSMWVLPGYREVLERFYPGLRERHEAQGVPDDFSNSVGWVLEGADARWTVTFAVADTDRTVERAVALGATVRVAPHTVDPVRTAELTDPQGVAFTVNTYQPGRG